MKVYVFQDRFLVDWTEGLGVIFADSRKDAIRKMAKLVAGEFENSIADNVAEFSKLDIEEYTLENFPGIYTYGGA